MIFICISIYWFISTLIMLCLFFYDWRKNRIDYTTKKEVIWCTIFIVLSAWILLPVAIIFYLIHPDEYL
jgi:hypothetical protein